jgi:hypothetical protein
MASAKVLSAQEMQSWRAQSGNRFPTCSSAQPGGIDQPVRELNIPFQMGASPQER